MKAVLAELISLLVPPACVACRGSARAGEVVCDSCLRALPALGSPRCIRCGAPTLYEVRSCRECSRRSLEFERAWAPVAYEGPARSLVFALKFRGTFAAAELMGRLMFEHAPGGLFAGSLVPVPLTPRRRRGRGFNQAQLVARVLARRAGLEVRECLIREANTTPQVGLERSSRLANPAGTVALKGGGQPPGCALLVDDVYTTGATLSACAQTLRSGGALHVGCVTFARTVQRSTRPTVSRIRYTAK